MSSTTTRWVFERVSPNTSGSSGKIIDLFRNEGAGERGFLQQSAPAYAATLMAREVIQNSWDAAEELRGTRPEAPPFAIDFLFDALKEERKRALIAALGLEQLADHAKAVAPTDEERERLGLGAWERAGAGVSG